MTVFILDKRAHWYLGVFFRGPNGELFDETTDVLGQQPKFAERAQELADEHGVNVTVIEVAEIFAYNWTRISKRVTKVLIATPSTKKEV